MNGLEKRLLCRSKRSRLAALNMEASPAIVPFSPEVSTVINLSEKETVIFNDTLRRGSDRSAALSLGTQCG
jgi:hypothetical protein